MSVLDEALAKLSEFAKEYVALGQRVSDNKDAGDEKLAELKNNTDYMVNGICRSLGLINKRIEKSDQAIKDLVLAVAYARVGNNMINGSQLASGILMGRQYTADRLMSPKDRVHDVAFGAINLHNHPNYEAMPGLAEMAVIANGIPYRSRHNDYRMYQTGVGAKPVPAVAPGLPVWLSDTNIPKGLYLESVFRDNPEDVRMDLSYIELWMKPVGDVSDEVDSFRHAELYSNLLENFQQATKLDALGDKDILENVSVGPVQLVGLTDAGSPIYGQPAFRIRTHPIGTMAGVSEITKPTIQVDTSDSHDHEIMPLTDEQWAALVDGDTILLRANGSGHVHRYYVSLVDGEYVVSTPSAESHTHELVISQRHRRSLPPSSFKLIEVMSEMEKGSGYDRDKLLKSTSARFRLDNIDEIIQELPGMDGEGAVITEVSSSGNPYSNDDGTTLNSAYYHHEYRLNSADAAGRRRMHRGFNDPNLIIARTNNPDVLNGVSYCIPLEVVARTAREVSNIAGVPLKSRDELRESVSHGFDGSSADMALPGWNPKEYNFTLPAAVFSQTDDVAVDAADTRSAAWVKDSEGNPILCYAAGIRHISPDGHRIRYPIYPMSHEYSYASVQLEHLIQGG